MYFLESVAELVEVFARSTSAYIVGFVSGGKALFHILRYVEQIGAIIGLDIVEQRVIEDLLYRVFFRRIEDFLSVIRTATFDL